MDDNELIRAVVAEVGSNASPQKYQEAMERRLRAGASNPTPDRATNDAASDERVAHAKDYAAKNGVDLVTAFKALGYAS